MLQESVGSQYHLQLGLLMCVAGGERWVVLAMFDSMASSQALMERKEASSDCRRMVVVESVGSGSGCTSIDN